MVSLHKHVAGCVGRVPARPAPPDGGLCNLYTESDILVLITKHFHDNCSFH